MISSILSSRYSSVTIVVGSLLYQSTSNPIFLLAALFGVAQYLYSMQDALLYQPNMPPTTRNCNPLPRSQHEVINFGENGRLNGFLFKCDDGKCPTIIFFHGNAGNAANRTPMVEFMRTLLRVNVFIFDYSGYGLSRGIPSEKQFYRDGQNAINFVESRDDLGEGIFLFGRSLGGAVVIDLAVRPENENLSGIIVENTFTSVPAMGTVLFSPAAPIINLLPQFAIKNKFYSDEKVQKLSIPVLFISGKDDELVPPGMMHKLYSLCDSKQKYFAKMKGQHNNTWTTPGYFDKMKHFLHEDCKNRHPTTLKPIMTDEELD
jgi:pimeloyl-ACP methyl ester carboxylesterase